MTQKTLLQIEGTTSEAFAKDVAKQLHKIFEDRRKEQHSVQDPFITRQDVADMYKISLVSVHAWMNAGILKPYKIGNKTRFLLSEVKEAALGAKKEGGTND